MVQLPGAYIKRMEALLGNKSGAFLKSYEEAPEKGLRFNTKKIRPETMEKLVSAWHLKRVPWCEAGFYYSESGPQGVRPGKSPYHDAGVFYIQEPSAMLPASLLSPKGHEAVLDLCAAPGGKSTQAAMTAGFVVSNEYVRKRAQILSSNIERMGLSNVIVCNASTGALSAAFPGFFDCVLVDAPCSGEGMMRRDETAVREWSEENVRLCEERQRDILDDAVSMLRPGGRLVYSTCTFEPSENGRQTEALLLRHPALRLISERQLWPQDARGEGHYCALFRMDGGAAEAGQEAPLPGGTSARAEETAACMQDAAERLRRARIPVLRCGIEPGKKLTGKHRGETRYEPSHAEALAMGPDALSRLSLNLFRTEDALSYLRGESLSLSALSADAYMLRLPEEAAGGLFLPVCYDDYPLGWGKYVGGTVKNHYPKGLRRLGNSDKVP